MNQTYVDKLPEKINNVKFLLVCQDLFDSTLDAKRKRKKNSQDDFRFVSNNINRKIDHKY